MTKEFLHFFLPLIFILIIFGYHGIPVLRDKIEENNRLKRIKKDEEELIKEEEKRFRELNKQEALEQKEREKQSALKRYLTFSEGIRKIPKYETWRHQIFNKYGKICERNGEGCTKTENLEIHHRQSLNSIYLKEGFDLIMSTNGLEKALDKAIGSNQLWNVDNGSVLCHKCHERQDSSQNFLKNK